jgi:hypothetical protein
MTDLVLECIEGCTNPWPDWMRGFCVYPKELEAGLQHHPHFVSGFLLPSFIRLWTWSRLALLMGGKDPGWQSFQMPWLSQPDQELSSQLFLLPPGLIQPKTRSGIGYERRPSSELVPPDA